MAGQCYEVPNKLFFVRTHRDTPLLDATTWRLRIDRSGVDKPLELSYQEILALPSASERKVIERAGNGRSFFATYRSASTVAPGCPRSCKNRTSRWHGRAGACPSTWRPGSTACAPARPTKRQHRDSLSVTT
jgi:DMSO/TMAO reductase YedYZ molybdopterin-dependent catalytic subunit